MFNNIQAIRKGGFFYWGNSRNKSQYVSSTNSDQVVS